MILPSHDNHWQIEKFFPLNHIFFPFYYFSLEFGIWNLEFGTWNLVLGIWYLEFGTWNLVLNIKVYSNFLIIVEIIFLNCSDSSINFSISVFSKFPFFNNLNQYLDSLASFLEIFSRNTKSLSPTFSFASI